MKLKEKLGHIQQEMKAPKNLRNTFGGYNYRNAEGILEAFKPYEDKYNVTLLLSDQIEAVEGRVYVVATATIFNADDGSNESLSVQAWAREQEDKKGMDAAQITGAASSYARKYALNGIFLLDDTKDPDTDEAKIESDARAVSKAKIGAEKAKALEVLCSNKGVPVDTIYKQYGVTKLADLTEEQHLNIVKRLEKTVKK